MRHYGSLLPGYNALLTDEQTAPDGYLIRLD